MSIQQNIQSALHSIGTMAAIAGRDIIEERKAQKSFEKQRAADIEKLKSLQAEYAKLPEPQKRGAPSTDILSRAQAKRTGAVNIETQLRQMAQNYPNEGYLEQIEQIRGARYGYEDRISKLTKKIESARRDVEMAKKAKREAENQRLLKTKQEADRIRYIGEVDDGNN